MAAEGLQSGLQVQYFGSSYKSVTKLPDTADSIVNVNNAVIPEGMGKGGKAFGAKCWVTSRCLKQLFIAFS
ncbi:hypothetical protein [Chitinophaga pinensis]|uniref:hypothetical protein n=1 Tax=Chitinophaga pinensis TaxID=79329 RepID=UPI001C995FC3|nr:hypothetical protein [Chitinophaga pinensis]